MNWNELRVSHSCVGNFFVFENVPFRIFVDLFNEVSENNFDVVCGLRQQSLRV